MSPRRKRKLSPAALARKHGWRSGLEGAIGDQLNTEGISFDYESEKVPFIQPAKKRTYTPDFFLPNGIVIESKGRFLTADRQKHKLIKEQYPDLDLRFVFSRSSTRLSKRSKTTYARWCDSNGFLYADRLIPQAWLKEARNRASLACLDEITGGRAEERIKETLKKLNHIYRNL